MPLPGHGCLTAPAPGLYSHAPGDEGRNRIDATPSPGLPWLPLLVAALDWAAVAKNWKRLEYLAKPGTMLALLAWMWTAGPIRGPLVFFALGVIFSLAGDVLLMLPRERFLGGLVAFLAAHLAYIAGFNTTPPPLNLVTLLFMALVSICAAWVYRRVALGLRTGGHSQLQAPVAAYVVAIGLMVLSALLTLTRPEWAPSHALLASLGAVLFFVSDGLLAWNRFVSPIPHGRLLVIVTYHLGQIIMVAGVTLNALR